MNNLKLLSSDTYAAIAAMLFALTANIIPAISHWPIPSRGTAIDDYFLVTIMASSPLAILLSVLALIRAAKSGKSSLDIVIACICLILSLGLIALYT